MKLMQKHLNNIAMSAVIIIFASFLTTPSAQAADIDVTDNECPRILKISIDKQVLSFKEKTILRFTYDDDKNSFDTSASGYSNWTKPSNLGTLEGGSPSISRLTIVKSTKINGRIQEEVEGTLTAPAAAGIWKFGFLSIYDKGGNYISFEGGNQLCSRRGYIAAPEYNLDLTIINSNPSPTPTPTPTPSQSAKEEAEAKAKAEAEAKAKAEAEAKAKSETDSRAAAEKVICDGNRAQLLSVQSSLIAAVKSYPKSASALNETLARLQSALRASCVADVTLNDFRAEALSVIAKAKTSSASKQSTITCVKGKLTKKVTGINPKCPKGYKKK